MAENSEKTDVLGLARLACKTLMIPVHPAGWPFIAGFAVVSLLLGLMWELLGILGVVLTLWCVYFFRDPVRVTPQRKGLIISPADGIVSMIEEAAPPPELDIDDALLSDDGKMTRISVFLNVFDVHVNRIPAKGTIKHVHYHPGKFLSANLDKASEENERSTVLMTLEDGKPLIFVQIAGLVARRIICKLEAGQNVEAGARYGLIRFGSRADVYLPKGGVPQVSVGQRMIGGETVLADLESTEKPRATKAS